ncbi:hypothetical protein GCM10009634_78270 [Saccharothrix xinjiangensis]
MSSVASTLANAETMTALSDASAAPARARSPGARSDQSTMTWWLTRGASGASPQSGGRRNAGRSAVTARQCARSSSEASAASSAAIESAKRTAGGRWAGVGAPSRSTP